MVFTDFSAHFTWHVHTQKQGKLLRWTSFVRNRFWRKKWIWGARSFVGMLTLKVKLGSSQNLRMFSDLSSLRRDFPPNKLNLSYILDFSNNRRDNIWSRLKKTLKNEWSRLIFFDGDFLNFFILFDLKDDSFQSKIWTQWQFEKYII